MDLLLFIMLLQIKHSISIEKPCNRFKIGDNYFEKELVWTGIGRPYNLNAHRRSNTIFFSYSTVDRFEDVDFQLAYVDIDSKLPQNIAGIRGGCAVTINQKTDDIYLGGIEGIYKYNMVTKIADFYSEAGKNIWSLSYNRNLFYISYPDQKLFIEVNGKFAVVKEFKYFEVDHFHVSNKGWIYFANSSGLFTYDNYKMKVYVLNNLLTVRQMAEDAEGNMYICAASGVYVITKDNKTLKQVIDLKNLHGLTFDRENNIIFSDESSIIRLQYRVNGCDEPNKSW